MIVFGLVAAGTAIGFVWQKRRSRSTGQDERPESFEGRARPMHIVVSGGRRAFAISLVLLRQTALQAFKRTAAHYAPVPLTFSAAILSNLPAIFGTAFSINYVVVNGIPLLGHIACRRARRRRSGLSVDSAASIEDPPASDGTTKSAAVTHAICCSTGIVGYFIFMRQWENSPLRGTLSVFGKGADLDRCASAERYLADKLALLSYAACRGVASLRQLMSPGSENGGGVASSSSGLPAATRSTDPLPSYARGVVGVSAVLPEVQAVFSEYSARYIEYHEDMNVLSGKLKYPGIDSRPIKRASDLLLVKLRGKSIYMDTRDKLEELHRELGNQFQLRFILYFMTLSGGVFAGIELANHTGP